jgi:hypothetical protein
MRNTKPLRMILVPALLCALAGAQKLHGQTRSEWPEQVGPLTTNQLPADLDGVPHGFLGASFHIEHFDARTTLLRGNITLTNLTDTTNGIALSLVGPCIAGQIEICDPQGNAVRDPNGILHNWKAQWFSFAPHEGKRQAFELRLRDYFDIKPGKFQLLFVFNELLVRHLPNDGWHMRPWSRERLVLLCE